MSFLAIDVAHSVDTTPLKINFQGRLTDAAGVPVNGQKNLIFRFYTASVGGTLLYAESRSDATGNPLTVTQGNYAVELGGGVRITPNGAPGDPGGEEASFAAMFAGNTDVWLEVQVSGEAAMSPRIRVLAAGYAVNADLLDGQDGVYYLNSSNQSAGTLPVARLPLDGYASTYVNTTGDTMTGALQIDGSGVGLKLNAAADGSVDLNFQSAETGTAHWAFSKRGVGESHVLSLYKDGGGTPVTTWTKAGYVLTPYRPAFAVRITSQFVGPTGVVPFDTEDADVGNNFSTTTYQFTAPVAGAYWFSFQGIKYDGVTTSVARVNFRVNGVQVNPQARASEGANYGDPAISRVIVLNAGDTVDCYSSGSTGWYTQYTYFSGFLIG
ncbi:MAG: hypothetical protein HY719_15575 [Planctomycetes bacterium]|nr:hypothetical protein [Planctomycetota bacterium]